MYEYFDIHSHLNFPQFDSDREEIIALMAKRKIGTITVGTDLKSSREAVALAEQHSHLYACVGLHPADNHNESFNEHEYVELLKNPKTVAIGECGLDYAKLPETETAATAEKKRQKIEFEKQIHFAVLHEKPLMIHCRDAYPDTIALLSSKKKEYGDRLRGNFHFFTSPIEIARQCLELDFTLSFTGPITFVADYADIVRYVPVQNMMAETDAPFAAPNPFRGKRNNPLYVEEIVKKIAEIKDQGLDKVKKQLVSNVFELFLKKIS